MVNLTNLNSFKERMVVNKPAPILSDKEFEILMRAARWYTREKLQRRQEGETPRMKWRRNIERVALDTAINKLRNHKGIV